MLTEVVVVARTTDSTRLATRDEVVLFFFAFECVALVLGSTVLFGWVTGTLADFFAFPLTTIHVHFTGVLVVTLFAQRFAAGFVYTNTAFLKRGGRFANLATLAAGRGGRTRWTANSLGVLWVFLVAEELAFASDLAAFASFADVLTRIFDTLAAKAQRTIGVFAVGVSAACGFNALVLRVALGANGVFAVCVGGAFYRLFLALAVFAFFFVTAVCVGGARLLLAFAAFAFGFGGVFAVAVALAFRFRNTLAVKVAFLAVFAIAIGLALHCRCGLALR